MGVEHIFASRLPARISVDLYRSNLRTSAERFIPPASCLPSSEPLPPAQACESFPINAGDAVYQGIETRFEHNLTRSLILRATYSLNRAFPQTVSPSFQNGSLVIGEQFQGVPLHTLNFGIERETAQGLSYSLRLHHEDGNNALNRPAFTTAQAGAAWRLRSLELGVHATNLTKVYADRFTLAGRGVPYAGLDGPIATDAYSLQGRAFTFSATRLSGRAVEAPRAIGGDDDHSLRHRLTRGSAHLGCDDNDHMLLCKRIGALTACLFFAWIAQSRAATSTANLSVSATVIAVCSVATTPVAFGNYSGSAVQANGSVIVTCTVGSPYTVDLGQGQNYSSGRRMAFTTNFLGYQLFKDNALTQIWGSTSGGSTAAGTGTGLPQTLTVFGDLPASQSVPVGAYADTVVATVSF